MTTILLLWLGACFGFFLGLCWAGMRVYEPREEE
jgi:hypothetical protein